MRHLIGRCSVLVLLLVLAIWVCGGGRGVAAPAASDAAPTPGAAVVAAAHPADKSGPPVPWKDMDVKQRGHYMKTVVTPRMKAVFQAFDADAFKRFGCPTCHGKDPQEHKFKMPSSDVHPLPPTPAAFEAMLKQQPTWPKWTKFMGEKVEPQMAELLGLPLFNPKSPTAGGFSCQACHTLMKS